MLVITASPEEGQRLADDLRFFSQSQKLAVEIFPSYHLLPFKFLSYHNQTASERIRVLYRLMSEAEPLVVVTTAPALLQRLVPRQELSRYAELIQVGEEIEREQLIAKLISGGYLRTAIVEEPGDFSVRGGKPDKSEIRHVYPYLFLQQIVVVGIDAGVMRDFFFSLKNGHAFAGKVPCGGTVDFKDGADFSVTEDFRWNFATLRMLRVKPAFKFFEKFYVCIYLHGDLPRSIYFSPRKSAVSLSAASMAATISAAICLSIMSGGSSWQTRLLLLA